MAAVESVKGVSRLTEVFQEVARGAAGMPLPAAVSEESGDPAAAPSSRVQAAKEEAVAPAQREAVEDGVRKLNLLLLEAPLRLSFQLHEETGRMMVRLINLQTGEIVKEIPPHEVLDTIARIMEFVGLLLDRRM